MDLGDRIKEARKAKGMSQDTLADKLGINRVSISNYEKGKNRPTFNNLIMLSRILDADLVVDGRLSSVKQVPIIGTASCGGTDINHLQEANKTAPYSGNSFTDALYCVIANGDSMAVDIENGDEVICDPNIKPISGDMVHYQIGGESAIKILWVDEEANIIQLIPYNPSDDFKIVTIRLDDERASDLRMAKVVAVNKLKLNNRAARLRLIGRG